MKKVLMALVFIMGISSVYAQTEGILDLTFGLNGKVTTDIDVDADFGQSVVVQTDGKIIVGGSTNTVNGKNFALIRYNTNGTIDNTFGIFGKAIADLGGDDVFWSMAIQQDEKIVAGGYTVDTNYDTYWVLVRFKINGLIDSTFGTNGIVITDFGGGQNQGYSIAIQPDEKIIMSGLSGVFPNSDFALARYNSDGLPDITFGTGGKVITDFGDFDFGNVVTIHSGKIIVAGDSMGEFAMARYNLDGSLDTTFGGDGKVTSILDTNSTGNRIWSIAAQADGKIVAGGYVGTPSKFELVRYNLNGSIDSTFGVNGRVSTPLLWDAVVHSVLIQPDGKIVAAGETYNLTFNTSDFAMVRYNTDGTLDASFGSFGKVVTDFGERSNDVGLSAATANGKIYIAGRSNYMGTIDFALACYIGQVTSVGQDNPVKPNNYYLSQNYPNPFNPNTTIKFSIPNVTNVTLKIHDVLGREIETLVNNKLNAGEYEVKWNASKYSSGIYLYRLQTGEFVQTKKLILLR